MYFIYLCAKITRNIKITLDNMVFAVTAADWAADEPAAFAHFAVAYAALAAAYCRQHGAFKQPCKSITKSKCLECSSARISLK